MLQSTLGAANPLRQHGELHEKIFGDGECSGRCNYFGVFHFGLCGHEPVSGKWLSCQSL
jgi:hypothetical protein